MNRMLTPFLVAGLLAAGCATGTGDNGRIHNTPSAAMTGPAATITKYSEPVTLLGASLRAGEEAPDVPLVTRRLTDVRIADFRGKVLVVSSVPSLDTPVCCSQTIKLNRLARRMGSDLVVVSVSMDLPFALDRYASKYDVHDVQLLTDYHYRSFGEAYGVRMKDSSLLARAVFVIDREGVIRHLELVGDLANEPDYRPIVDTVKELLGLK